MENEIDQLVDKLQLQPHPEGGFFRETYRSDLFIPAPWEKDNESSRR